MKRKNKKSILLLLSLVMILGTIIGVTVAMLIDKTDGLKNTFKPSEVQITIEEEFDGNTKSNVKINNPASTVDHSYADVYVRVMLVCNWYYEENGNDKLIGKPSWNITDVANELQLNSTDWFLGDDGYYYYKKILKSGEETTNLIHSIKLLKDAGDGSYQGLEVIAEAIQAGGVTTGGSPAVQIAWPAVTVNSNKQLEKTTP